MVLIITSNADLYFSASVFWISLASNAGSVDSCWFAWESKGLFVSCEDCIVPKKSTGSSILGSDINNPVMNALSSMINSAFTIYVISFLPISWAIFWPSTFSDSFFVITSTFLTTGICRGIVILTSFEIGFTLDIVYLVAGLDI